MACDVGSMQVIAIFPYAPKTNEVDSPPAVLESDQGKLHSPQQEWQRRQASGGFLKNIEIR